jgi:hypothetical protein
MDKKIYNQNGAKREETDRVGLPVAKMEAMPTPMRTDPPCSQSTEVSPKKARTKAPAAWDKAIYCTLWNYRYVQNKTFHRFFS